VIDEKEERKHLSLFQKLITCLYFYLLLSFIVVVVAVVVVAVVPSTTLAKRIRDESNLYIEVYSDNFQECVVHIIYLSFTFLPF